MRRALIGTTLVLAASMIITTPAMAAAPANDTHAGRIAIETLPFHDEVDTRAATTDANDARANEECGAPATDASVWYSVRAPSDRGLVVDVSGSTYPAGVIVVTGRPRSFSLVTCGPETVGLGPRASSTRSSLSTTRTMVAGTGASSTSWSTRSRRRRRST
jgi:hypothetical protein